MYNNKIKIIQKLLNKNLYKLKEYQVSVNGGKTFFENEDYNVIEGVPKYFEKDAEGRATGGIAIISKNTLSIRIA